MACRARAALGRRAVADRLFSSLVPRVTASVPMCPNALALDYIRTAAVEACEETGAWFSVTDNVELETDRVEYAYHDFGGVADNADVAKLDAAYVNGYAIDLLSRRRAMSKYPDFLTEKALEDWSGTPRAAFQSDSEHVTVLPAADTAGEYLFRMSLFLEPPRDADGLPQGLFDAIEDAVFNLALYYLLLLPDKDWQDARLAGNHLRQYKWHAAWRRGDASRGDSPGSLMARPPTWA